MMTRLEKEQAKQWFTESGYFFRYESCKKDGKFYIDNEKGIQLCRKTKKKRFWWWVEVTEELKFYHLESDKSLWGGVAHSPQLRCIMPTGESHLRGKLEDVMYRVYQDFCKEQETKILKESLQTTRYP